MKFLSKYENEIELRDRYKIAIAQIISGIIELFTLPFRYGCNYHADIIVKVILDGIAKRKKDRKC